MARVESFLSTAETLILEGFAAHGVTPSRSYLSFLAAFLKLGLGDAEGLEQAYSTLLETPLAARSRFQFIAGEEACGASIISHMAQWAAPDLASAMVRHAEDEGRHMRMFQRIGQAFAPDAPQPGPVMVNAERELGDIQGSDLPKFLCSVHASEVRAYAAYVLIRGLAKDKGDKGCRYLARMLDAILDDEIRHVVYTGAQIDGWEREGAGLYSAMAEGFPQYAAFWRADVAQLRHCISSPADSNLHPRLREDGEVRDNHVPSDPARAGVERA